MALACVLVGCAEDEPGYAGATGAGGSFQAGTGATGGGSGGQGGTGGMQGSGGGTGTGGLGGTGGLSGTGGLGGTGGLVGTGGGTVGPDARCMGLTPMGAGTHLEMLTAGGAARNYRLYIPQSHDATQAKPLVFVHHGLSMSGEIMQTLTTWQAIADEEGLIVAYPDGVGSSWSVGDGAPCGVGALSGSAADDLAFTEMMIDTIATKACIDRDAVFVTGFSMGGYYTNNIGCARPDLVRAIAPHSGGAKDATCATPMPAIIIHGDADGLISGSCGPAAGAKWAATNGCGATSQPRPIMGGSCAVQDGCPADAPVETCMLAGMGHGWSGGTVGAYAGGAQYEDGARLAWGFFSSLL